MFTKMLFQIKLCKYSKQWYSPVSDKEAVQFVSEHFGFDKTKITINRMKPVYEINRHQQVRQIGAAVRNPYIFASDWNYICFSSMGIDYEIQNGTIFPYV